MKPGGALLRQRAGAARQDTIMSPPTPAISKTLISSDAHSPVKQSAPAGYHRPAALDHRRAIVAASSPTSVNATAHRGKSLFGTPGSLRFHNALK